jgi:hypothetical protein
MEARTFAVVGVGVIIAASASCGGGLPPAESLVSDPLHLGFGKFTSDDTFCEFVNIASIGFEHTKDRACGSDDFAVVRRG